MRKTNILHRMMMLGWGFVALAILSCTKEAVQESDNLKVKPAEEQMDNPGDTDDTIPEEPDDECGYQEEGDPFGGNLVEVNITAEAAEVSKTTLGSGNVVNWAAGDAVRCRGHYVDGSTKKIVSYDATAKTTGHTTAFTPVTVREDLQPYLYITYPASTSTYLSANVDGTPRVRIKFPKAPTSSDFGAANIVMAKTRRNNSGVWGTSPVFKNVSAIFKINITDADIDRIVISSEGGEYIACEHEYGITDAGTLFANGSINDNDNKSTTITLDIDGTGVHYIAAHPCTLSTGFRVTPYKGEEAQTPFCYLSEYVLERGKIVNLGTLNDHTGQFYVTPDGAGNNSGISWTHAMSESQFKTFVENQDNYDRITGATFHFSDEEFSFGDNYVYFNYPDHSNVAFTLEGTVTATDTTTFLGRTAKSGTTAGVLWGQSNSYVTVKNVKFTGTDGASNASAIRLNSGAKEFTLDHCYFRNNQTAGNGGSISLFNGCTLRIQDCSFSNNTGAGGMVHVNNASAIVIIQDCEAKGLTKNAIWAQGFDSFSVTGTTFKDNEDAGEWGAAAYINGSGTMEFTDCEFTRNHSTVAGGAICISGSGPSVSFTDCDFIDNSCDKRGGAVMIENGNANTTFTGGKFQGNHADGTGTTDPETDNTNAAGGAIYAIGSGVEFSCTDVLFKQNYNYVAGGPSVGGIIRVMQNNGVAKFDGCTFDGNYTNRNTSTGEDSYAAIIQADIAGAKYYFNACEFKNNTSGSANADTRYGGCNGTVIASLAACTIAMNNCSIHDNYGGRNKTNGRLTWIYTNAVDNTFIMSNCTVVGDQKRPPSTGDSSVKSKNGVIRFDSNGTYCFINSIICSNYSDGKSVGCADTYDVPAYYCKVSPGLDSDTNWTNTTGFGDDYWASSSCFGSWSSPWTWNGTMTGTNSGMKAATADVNTQINSADSYFYTWLNSIGALGKDINGRSRGATSWPGCYQN